MPNFRIAFYKGTRPGIAGIYNYLVRNRGRGLYSHVELIFSHGVSASSSFADGGVRFKHIDYTSNDWDILELPKEWEADAFNWFSVNKGRKYDVMGNVFLALGFFPHSKEKVFCSEAVGNALKIDDSWRLEPNTLYITIKRMLEIHKEIVDDNHSATTTRAL